jgi:glycosyltransferase involved in cell wall biosynthesis
MRVRRAAARAFHAIGLALTVPTYVVLVVPASRIARRRRRARGDQPRILWAGTPLITLGYLAEASRLRGYDSRSLVFSVYSINARSDFDYVVDFANRIPGVRLLVPYLTFLWAGLRFDVFGFFFDGGLLATTPYWRVELALLKLAGKSIIVLPYGSDARLPSRTRALDRWNAYTDVPAGKEDRDEADVQAHLDAFGRRADVVLGNNDLVEDLPRLDGVLPYPIDDSRYGPAPAPEDDVVTVVHASNHRHYKGTRFLEAAVDRLREEGLPVELDVVEGVPLSEARRRYERADVIAADFLVGGYANFAVEAMALGKPVLSYLRPRTARFHPEWSECPVVSANPDTLVDELRTLVTDAELRSRLGERGPAYVREYHSLPAVGAQLDAVYREVWSRPAAGGWWNRAAARRRMARGAFRRR